jgi:AraC-like DNA-binding protein
MSRRIPHEFHYHSPSPALEGRVAFHYVLKAGDEPFDETLCALLGQVQLGFGGSATYHFAQGPIVARAACVIAPTDRAVRMTAPAGFVAVGSALTPLGWTLLNEGRSQVDAVVDATSKTLDRATRGHPRTAVTALDDWIVARLASGTPDSRVDIIDAWIVADEGEDVDALTARLNMSRRSLERLTLRTHGATPKRLSAKYRTLKVAAAMAVGEVADWRLAPAAAGFADQSHFIREFRRYVGVTPGAFMADKTGFARRLIEGRWNPGKAMGIAIWA